MRYLYIRLEVQDGNRSHTQHCIESTECKDLNFAVAWFTLHYWGHGEIRDKNPDCCYFDDGEISVSVSSWSELSEEEYKFLNHIMYGL